MTELMKYWADRIRCRLFRIHGLACRGRPDHTTATGKVIDPERWRP